MADLDRAIADAKRKKIPYAGQPPDEALGFGPAPKSESIIDNAVGAVTGFPAQVARGVTGLINPSPSPVAAAPVPAGVAPPMSVPTSFAPAPAPVPTPYTGNLFRNDLSGPISGSIGSSFPAAAVAGTAVGENPIPAVPVVAPDLKKIGIGQLPRMDYDVGYGQNRGGGVFGAMARQVNAVSDFAATNIQRKAASKGFADQVTASTTNTKNTTDVYDSKTKRMGVESTAAIAQAKSLVDAMKSGKEVQETELIKTHRALLDIYIKNPTPEVADMIALVKGHVLQDKVINFPESVMNATAPSAVSVRHGTSITPNKGGGGFTVAPVTQAGPTAADKVYMNEKGQRVRIVNGQQVPF